MHKKHVRWNTLGVIVALSMGVAGSALAEKPDWAGGPGQHRQGGEWRDDRGPDRADYRHGGDGRAGREAGRSGTSVDIRIGGYFGDAQRSAAQDYYQQQFHGGHCPPGLARKRNGCLPPGQARKWALGRPLPSGVVYYPLEPGIQIKLGAPPAGHRFVRVAADILLIAVGTSMVVDAIEDLGR